MAGIIEFRRGNTGVVATITPLSGELLDNLDDDSLRVGDGATVGGMIVGGRPINAQTGTAYTVATSDQGRLLTLNNASPVAVALPQAGVTNNFPDGATLEVLNLGAGTVTITPDTSTINGNSTLDLLEGFAAFIRTDGTDYLAIVVAFSEGGLGVEITSLVLSGSAIPLTTGMPVNVTSITLTPGTWEVSGTVGFLEDGTTVSTEEIAAISTTTGALPTFPSDGGSTASRSGTGATGIGSILPIAQCRITVVSGTTDVFLVAQATFTVSTDAAYGQIRAVRVA